MLVFLSWCMVRGAMVRGKEVEVNKDDYAQQPEIHMYMWFKTGWDPLH